MPKLILVNFIKDEAHCLDIMLDSVQPYMSDIYFMIDDRTTDNTKEICDRRGCITKYYVFENFGKTWNTMLDWTKDKSDWIFVISPDEAITQDFGEMLEPLIEQIHNTDIDGVWFPRRHWEDLEMKKEYVKQNWYPDWQMRLLRNDYPRVHLIHYVHEWPVGIRSSIRVNKDIHHFNMYWKPRIDYNFDKMNTLYEELRQREKLDGGKNIWPKEN